MVSIVDLRSVLSPKPRSRTLEALQLCTLMLPPPSRRKLHLLLRLMHKMVNNPELKLNTDKPTRTLVSFINDFWCIGWVVLIFPIIALCHLNCDFLRNKGRMKCVCHMQLSYVHEKFTIYFCHCRPLMFKRETCGT